MAKIGQLVLQAGRWNGTQLVSASWTERATQEHVRLDGGRPYGYLWWLAGLQVGEKRHKSGALTCIGSRSVSKGGQGRSLSEDNRTWRRLLLSAELARISWLAER